MKLSTLFYCFLLLFSCNAQQKNIGVPNTVNEESIAFPGAEGFGKYATGGRGGQVIIVSNLEDAGAGSLREAVKNNKPKIVVFSISGTIHLKSPLSIKGNTTIAGQSAPGDGICIADHPVQLGGDNIIVRYMRFRMGDRYQNAGKIPGSGHDDAFSGIGKSNIIIDHCSLSWSTDEVFSVYGGDSTTLQWNIISEPLNYSYHFEEGDKDFENHGYGGIWGGKHLSAHHNLFAHCLSRNPRFAGTRNIPEEFVDFRNNVIYNWGHNSVYGGEGGHYNIVNNYYKYGNATRDGVKFRIVNPSKQESPFIPFGKYYVNGNFVDGSESVTRNNSLGVLIGSGKETEEVKKSSLLQNSFHAVEIKMETAEDTYRAVLEQGGASFRRDTLDMRIINDVRNRTGRIIDVQGGFAHGTAYELTKHAWPSLKSDQTHIDSDMDGMPDEWENKNGLNPADVSDARGHKLDRHYTNIEVYLNSLVQKKI